MTPSEFRNLALSLPEAVESAHMGHPDFRVRGKIFATLGHAGKNSAMVKLPLRQQGEFVATEPAMFQPVAGGWGRQGATQVNLPAATEEVVRQAMIAAWRNTAPKRLANDFEEGQ